MTLPNHVMISCPVGERKSALRLLYRRVPEPLRDQLVTSLLDEERAGLLDLDGLWIARHASGRLSGALLTQRLASRAVAVWPPEVANAWRRSAIAGALVAAALELMKSQGILMAQALLEETAPSREGSDLTRGGMPYVTDLIYLERPTRPASPPRTGPLAGRFAWETYAERNAAEFDRIVEQTYIGSLDMPEIQGLRTLDDLRAGHRSEDRFNPSLWRIGRLEGEPESAAVFLLSDLPDRDVCEVAYLALTPSARGRGLGAVVLDEALLLAQSRADRLQLAVDARNTPAQKLYKSAGFEPFERRAVHFKSLVDPEPPTC